MWSIYIKGFTDFLRLERGAAKHTITAYIQDVSMLARFSDSIQKGVEDLSLQDLQSFLATINDKEMAVASQARIISGIKMFYRYLLLEEIVHKDPTELFEAPKRQQKLPEILSVEEVVSLIESVDLSTAEGHRNRAILEVMYSSGLRVSELIELKLTNLHLKEGFIIVIGKGNKERLVPIGDEAAKQVNIYLKDFREQKEIKKGNEDIVFLNKRGAKMSRVMIFYIIKNAATNAGIQKNISPHTMRHCFATHLIEGGADLRAVQEMLGHASITTTELYTHLDTQFLKDTLHKYHPKF